MWRWRQHKTEIDSATSAAKHEESKHGEEEERKMQFNGFESYTMKDSYKNLQDLDSMIFSGKAQNVATHGHKAHEAKVTQFVIEKKR